MDFSVRTPPDDYPFVINENRLISVSDFQPYLYFRALSDARYESDHREVNWNSLGCSFQVARAFDACIRVYFREGKPSDTNMRGVPDTGSESEKRREPIYEHDPTYHLTSDKLYSQIQIRVVEEGGFSLDVPTAAQEIAGQTLAKSQMIGPGKILGWIP